MKIQYQKKRFTDRSRMLIARANEICDDYAEQGLTLTLRQLYYRFVAADVIENNIKSYNSIKKLVSNARMAGELDWDAIVDRTRTLHSPASWDSPSGIIWSAAHGYATDLWENQDCIVQVWVEKQALEEVIETASEKYRLPYFACKGYVSLSEMHTAALKLKRVGCPVHILHLGDHDPSGVDMTRDIQDRFNEFGADNVEIHRIALTMEQVRKLNAPPNPAKLTDTRAKEYIRQFGQSSWELDALDPKDIVSLVETEAEKFIDMKQWKKDLKKEKKEKDGLYDISNRYDDVVKFLKKKKK